MNFREILKSTTLPKTLKLLPIFAGFGLSACSTLDRIGTPANPEGWIEREMNACLPTAIVFKESLNKYGVWSEVVTYKSFNPETQKGSHHAIVVFNYPRGTENYWTYDFEGSYKIQQDSGSIGNQNAAPRDAAKTNIAPVDVKNPAQIAQLAEAKRFRPRSMILKAEFLN
jgi:hypothetical protein